MKTPFSAIALICAIFFSACGGNGVSNSLTPPSGATARTAQVVDPADGAAAAYCQQTGGEVEVRHAVYGSNGPSLLFLSGIKNFCQYTRKKDGSRIHILLSTLYTTKPSLAALAYILKPPTGSCQGNPASCYCSYLGGSDQFGGSTGAGGGWYEKKAIDQTLEACIFPDMSSIDSWGLAYHANGIIRGINLEKVMRYKYRGSLQ
jgi:putative hemolysin